MTLFETPLFETPLYQLDLIAAQQVLRFTWTEATRSMNFDHFRESCMVYAGLAIEHKVPLLLIDTRQFYYELPEDYMVWKEQELNPRYARVPVRKHAFILSPEGYEAYKDKAIEESGYINRYFKSEEDALNWLTD